MELQIIIKWVARSAVTINDNENDDRDDEALSFVKGCGDEIAS